MKPDKKARQYALAIFNVATKTDSILAVRDSLLLVTFLLKKDATFRAFFHTTKMTAADKVVVLSQVLPDSCHPLVAEFFAMLSDQKEWKLFAPTLRAFQIIQRSTTEVITVTAFSASEFDAAAVKNIEQELVNKLAKPVDFTTVVDPNLLGGLKLRIGNLFVDGSIQTRLEQLRHNLLQ